MHVFESCPTIEGAGVHLKRVFGNREVPHFDPFLPLDHFGSDNPKDYLRGFPWHPHRSIETVKKLLTIPQIIIKIEFKLFNPIEEI